MKFFPEQHLQQYLDFLNKGGVFAYPTDTVWGIGCLPDNEEACRKIYEIKHRDERKPLILMAASFIDFLPYVEDFPPIVQILAQRYWPGGLTIVIKKSATAPDYLTSGMDTIGLRIPNHPVLLDFLRYVGAIATTSANISGEPAALDFEQAQKCVGDKVDFIFDDYGFSAEGTASTVLLVEGDDYKILRQGSVEIIRSAAEEIDLLGG